MSPDPQGKRFVVQPGRDPPAFVARERADRHIKLFWQEIDRILDAMPARLAPLIAAESDEEKKRAILNDGIRDVIREVDATRESLLEKLFSTEH